MIGMPSPVMPGGAPVGVTGAPPPGGPTGTMPVAAGFDALFQQLTGGTLGAALTAGAIAPAGERDGDIEPGDEAEAAEPSLEAVAPAAVPVQVPVPVVPTPTEWVWTQPVAAGVDGVRDDEREGTSAAPIPDASAGPVSAAAVPPRSGPRETPGISPPLFAPPDVPVESFATSAVPPTPGHEAPGGPPVSRVVEPLPPVTVVAAPMAETGPRGPVFSPAGVPTSAPVDPRPVDPPPMESAPSALETMATASSRPVGATFVAEPSAPGIDGPALARPASDARHGRAREAAPEIGATETKEAAAPSLATVAAPAEAAAPATPTRRPLPAGALAAMERLASTSAATTGTASAAAPIRTEGSPTHGAAPVSPRHSGSSSNDGFGAHREGSQPGFERVPTGPSFRLVDTPAAPFGLGAPGLERPAMDRPSGAAVEMAPVRELEPALADSVHQQIVRSIRLQWTGSVGEARVSLKPEFLGEVTASINVERGVVTATLHADTPEVRTFIESHAASLRDALVEHGLRLDKLEVAAPEREPQTASDRHQQGRRRQQQEAPPKPRRREAEPSATFDFVSE